MPLTPTKPSAVEPHRTLRLKNRLLPPLLLLLLVAYLIAPTRSWLTLLLAWSSATAFSWLWANSLRRGLSLHRHAESTWLQVGHNLSESYTLRQTGLAPAPKISLHLTSDLPQHRLPATHSLPSRGQHRWMQHTPCTRRGVFQLGPLRLTATDPLGLFEISLTLPQTSTLTVTPPILPLPPLSLTPGGHTPSQTARQQSWHSSFNLAGVRPYRPGDPLTAVHWPTTARKPPHTGPYVRQFEHEPSHTSWLILNTAPNQAHLLEQSILIAAALTDRLLHPQRASGHALGLVAQHGPDLIWLPPQSGPAQRNLILQKLAQLQASPRPLSQLLRHQQTHLPRRDSLIIISPPSPPSSTHSWLPALSHLHASGHPLTVCLLESDPQATAHWLTHLAAQRIHTHRLSQTFFQNLSPDLGVQTFRFAPQSKPEGLDSTDLPPHTNTQNLADMASSTPSEAQ